MEPQRIRDEAPRRFNRDGHARQQFPAFGDAGPSLVDLARRSAPTVMIIANGSLHRPEQAEAMLKDGADLIALGRGALANQDWPLRARNRRELAPFDAALLAPFGDLKPCEITPGT